MVVLCVAAQDPETSVSQNAVSFPRPVFPEVCEPHKIAELLAVAHWLPWPRVELALGEELRPRTDT